MIMMVCMDSLPLRSLLRPRTRLNIIYTPKSCCVIVTRNVHFAFCSRCRIGIDSFSAGWRSFRKPLTGWHTTEIGVWAKRRTSLVKKTEMIFYSFQKTSRYNCFKLQPGGTRPIDPN
jgi:hypothetical protein